jgi:hypothetical protein
MAQIDFMKLSALHPVRRVAAPILLAVCLLLPPAWRANALVLVDKGRPQAKIVIATNASDQAREAATLLQDYLQRISGARLDIQDESVPAAGTQILVGRSQKAAALGVNLPARLTSAMNEEEYIIRIVGDNLILAGNEHTAYHGTVYAVNDLLERLGCRWFFPGAYGEVIPKLETVAIDPLNVHERPDFRFRNIWYSGWMPATEQEVNEFNVWRTRNRMNSLAGLSLPADGSILRLAPSEKYFASHPHIYAIDKKGERSKEMLCLTEPDAVAIAAETIKQELRTHPEMLTFGFAPPDGHPQCFCSRCEAANANFTGKGLGEPSLSDVWFGFANAVATEVAKEFPDRWLLTNGYANRVRFPEGIASLSPNLGIQSALLDCCTFHSIDDPKCWQRQLYKDVLDRWTSDLRCVFIYDYDPGKSIDGMPFPMLHNLQNDFPYFKDRGVWGFWTEGQNCWMVTHLNYYARSKLMWNARSDVGALVRDYCEKFYGAAAQPVQEYIWTQELAVNESTIHETFGRLTPWRIIYSPKVMARLDRCLTEAVKKASNKPEAAHVHVLELVHNYVRAYLAMETAAAEADFSTAVRHADNMISVRSDLGKINPSLIPVTPEWASKGDGALEFHRQTYQELADRINGTNGRLVAVAPRQWQFRQDPEKIGQFKQWYAPNANGQWKELDATLYWEAQGLQDEKGYGYSGHAWYRTRFDVPQAAAGQPLRLTIGGIYSTKLWLWVNGRMVDHRVRQNTKIPFDIDVTAHIRPGQHNHIAMLIETLPPDRNARGGLHRRVFLWSPVRPL